MTFKASENTLSLDSFSPEAKALVGQAQKFTDSNKHPLFEPAHLFAILLDLPEVTQLFKSLGIDTVLFSNQLHGYLSKLSKGEEASSLTPNMIALLTRAKNNVDNKAVTSFDLLLALTQEKQGITASLCKQFDLSYDRLNNSQITDQAKKRDLNSCTYLTNLMTLAQTESPEVIIGRDKEVRRLVQILGRQSKNHPLLVGEHGVGKHTILLALVDRINTCAVPKVFKNVMIVQLNTSALIAGTKTRTEVEERLNQALQYLQGYSAVLYVRSIETLMVQGLNLNLNDLFGMMFSKNNIRVVTSCTPEQLKKLSEKEGNLLKEFTQLLVEPCSPECAIEVLRGVAARYERHHNIKIGEGAIGTAVKLAKRYVQDRFLPESAIDLMDEAASNKMMEVTGVPVKLDRAKSRLASIKAQLTGLHGDDDELSKKTRQSLEKEAHALSFVVNNHIIDPPSESEYENEAVLSEGAIAVVLGEWTGIPVSKFLKGETEKLRDVEAKLASKVIDQFEAVNAVAKAIKRNSVGLRNDKKPIGSFLFFGSSGVGKTLLAKAVAETLFDSEEDMIRVDASELQEKHTVSKLLGSPPGYQGAEEGGFLTEAVKKKPYSVVLFDEIEKAHPDIFNILLQVLDDGRLSDSKGKVVDFSNTIIVLTSNIGSKKILDVDVSLFDNQSGVEKIHDMISKDIRDFFRPEFLNRIDTQVIFKPLTKNSLGNILDIELSKLAKQLSERGLTLNVSDEVKQFVVENSYIPSFGARPLHRAIMKYIKDPISEFLLEKSPNSTSNINIHFDSTNTLVLN